MTTGLIATLAAYLFGSLSSAIILCRLAGLPDPRTDGSGNPGATNMLRLYGKGLAFATLTGDLLKGLLPLLAGRWLGVDTGVLALMGLAAFLGHLYPVFFSFRGGKGVATYIGVLFGLDWRAGAAFVLVWLAMALAFRYSSLSALVATLIAPAALWWLGAPLPVVMSCSLMAVMLVWRHRSNIRNLLAGKEHRIGSREGA
ncbi:MAG: glycerol-3-phosphate 1-O-acyltransferase [Gammaproteobacteria bacterium]|nr:MAG: glycerol-3-phosphate 1-O-acyltransferase [Gammaproteobacteria bacterium]